MGLLHRCYHKSRLTGEATGHHGNNLCVYLPCNEVSFFRLLHYLLIWFFSLSLSPLAPAFLCDRSTRAVGCFSRRQKIKPMQGKEGLVRPYSTQRELVAARISWSSSTAGKPRRTVKEGEVFCLVSAAGCRTLPTHSSACLDYPFDSGLETACKFFLSFLPRLHGVYCSLFFPLSTSVFQTHYFHVIRFI